MRSPQRARRSRPAARITHEMVEARYRGAQALARAGDGAEALAGFLWCHDEGMVAVGSYSGVRVSFLLSEIAKLGRSYPPALEALRERRDAHEKRLAAAPRRFAELPDYAALNHYLGEDKRTLALFDRLPRGSRPRESLGFSVYRLLVEAGRYVEACEVYPYKEMVSHFESMSTTLVPKDFPKAQKAELEKSIRYHAAKSSARDIEALLGAGRLAAARAHAARLRAFDKSATLRELLRAAAVRAGRADFQFSAGAAMKRRKSSNQGRKSASGAAGNFSSAQSSARAGKS